MLRLVMRSDPPLPRSPAAIRLGLRAGGSRESTRRPGRSASTPACLRTAESRSRGPARGSPSRSPRHFLLAEWTEHVQHAANLMEVGASYLPRESPAQLGRSPRRRRSNRSERAGGGEQDEPYSQGGRLLSAWAVLPTAGGSRGAGTISGPSATAPRASTAIHTQASSQGLQEAESPSTTEGAQTTRNA